MIQVCLSNSLLPFLATHRLQEMDAKFQANQVLADDEYSGPMTNAFGSTSSNSMGYGSSVDQPIDVNAIILDWMQQIKNFY